MYTCGLHKLQWYVRGTGLHKLQNKSFLMEEKRQHKLILCKSLRWMFLILTDMLINIPGVRGSKWHGLIFASTVCTYWFYAKLWIERSLFGQKCMYKFPWYGHWFAWIDLYSFCLYKLILCMALSWMFLIVTEFY